MNTLLRPVNQALFNQAELNIHHAAQLLAKFAQTFLPHAKDESHPSLKWNPENHSLIGKSTTGNPLVHLSLEVPTMKLKVLNEQEEALHTLKLEGLSPLAAEKWLVQAVAELELQASALDNMPYDIPEMSTGTFVANSEEFLTQWIAQRTLANQVFEEVQKVFDGNADIAIWPHHFDTGIYLAYTPADAKEQKALGLGWAIADSLVPENYLYLYAWTSKGDLDYHNLPVLSNGHWHIIPEGWKGGILKLSDLVCGKSIQDQKVIAVQFLQETSRTLLSKMDLPKLF